MKKMLLASLLVLLPLLSAAQVSHQDIHEALYNHNATALVLYNRPSYRPIAVARDLKEIKARGFDGVGVPAGQESHVAAAAKRYGLRVVTLQHNMKYAAMVDVQNKDCGAYYLGNLWLVNKAIREHGFKVVFFNNWDTMKKGITTCENLLVTVDRQKLVWKIPAEKSQAFTSFMVFVDSPDEAIHPLVNLAASARELDLSRFNFKLGVDYKLSVVAIGQPEIQNLSSNVVDYALYANIGRKQ